MKYQILRSYGLTVLRSYILIIFLLMLYIPVWGEETDKSPCLGGESEEASLLKSEKIDSYDPLVPQMFAFDNDNNIFASINNVDNSIDLIRKIDDKLERYKTVQVDIVKRRHDSYHIYRPKSVAIYEGYVVFLASHRDSCYLAVLDMDGNTVKKLKFAGGASAFSYSYEAKELYIAGETGEGYDVVALDTSKGMNNIELTGSAAEHYRKPKMSEKISAADPWGIGMSAIAMSIVFLGLMLLYLVFKNVGRTLIYIQKRRTLIHRSKQIYRHKTHPVINTVTEDDSGEIYAAITAAIHLYSEELNDVENAVLTINKVSRTYSPWSSKIHGLNTYFKK